MGYFIEQSRYDKLNQHDKDLVDSTRGKQFCNCHVSETDAETEEGSELLHDILVSKYHEEEASVGLL